jgi:hypothetical protein
MQLRRQVCCEQLLCWGLRLLLLLLVRLLRQACENIACDHLQSKNIATQTDTHINSVAAQLYVYGSDLGKHEVMST